MGKRGKFKEPLPEWLKVIPASSLYKKENAPHEYLPVIVTYKDRKGVRMRGVLTHCCHGCAQVFTYGNMAPKSCDPEWTFPDLSDSKMFIYLFKEQYGGKDDAPLEMLGRWLEGGTTDEDRLELANSYFNN